MTAVVAIDANLFLRHTVRRFLCAMQEVRGGQVLVPAEVLRESVRKYPRIVGRHAARVVERRAIEEWGRDWTPEQRSEMEGRTRAYGRDLARAFEAWAEQERRRNDAAWSVSEETEAASDLAMDLTASGAFSDDAGYGDPLILARFERQLMHGGMQGAAAAIREERMRWLGNEEKMIMELRTQAPDPSATRSAEERRIEAERERLGELRAPRACRTPRMPGTSPT